MTEIKIVDVRLKPWWKFWKIDNVEVTVEDERDNRRTLSIYKDMDHKMAYIDEVVFKEYVGYKYCTGDQFWEINQRKKIKKEPKPSKEELIQKYAEASVGETFDCVLLLSKEDP